MQSPPLPACPAASRSAPLCVLAVLVVADGWSLFQWLLYRYSCIDDSGFEKFLPRVWCLLRRYQVLSHHSCTLKVVVGNWASCLPRLKFTAPGACCRVGLEPCLWSALAVGDRSGVWGAAVTLPGDLRG